MFEALRYARELARYENFRRAAQALGISQSQLSRRIQALEVTLGCALFERSKQGVSITPEGSQILDEAAILLKAEEDFAARVSEIRKTSQVELRIGAGAFASQSWMPAAIAELAKTRPAASISVREMDWWRLADAVRDGEAHMAIGERIEPEDNPDIVVERLPERDVRFFVRAGHKLDGRNRLTIDEIAEFPLAAPRLPARIRRFLPVGTKLGTMSGDGRFFLPAIESATPRSMIGVVLASDAVCVTLPEMCTEHLKSGALVELPFHPPWLRNQQAIMYARGKPLPDAALAFRSAAKLAERRYFADATASPSHRTARNPRSGGARRTT
ncbi:MAG: LysR family transcriptional regulator [Bauldia sp.]|nr:LysR family transcriptional regulator [Bauldia sp.]